jgi:hypothetical protein
MTNFTVQSVSAIRENYEADILKHFKNDFEN